MYNIDYTNLNGLNQNIPICFKERKNYKWSFKTIWFIYEHKNKNVGEHSNFISSYNAFVMHKKSVEF
jgi:hypothetical protein